MMMMMMMMETVDSSLENLLLVIRKSEEIVPVHVGLGESLNIVAVQFSTFGKK